MLMPKLPLMPGTDITVWDTVDTTDTVWDTTDMDTVWDTVDTTDTDIPVLMVTTDTTSARGLLMPNLKPMLMPKLIPPLMRGTDTMAGDTDTDMADHTMVDTTDTVTDTDTDTTVKNCFFDVISCHFLNNPPFELSKPTLLPSAILLKTVFFFMKKIVTKLIFGPIVIKNSQKMPLSTKRDLCNNIIRTALWL